MKKYVLIIIVLTVSAGMLFSADATLRPVSARTEAMGGAGLATAAASDALFMNPANLGSRTFSINLPAISMTVFNPKAIIDEGIIEIIQEGGDNAEQDAALKYLEIITAGKGEVLTTDIATSFTGGGFGLGVQVQEQIHTLSEDGSSAADKLIGELNAATTIGYGFRLNFSPDVFSVDLGVSARFTYRAYTGEIGANDAIDYMNADDPMAEFMEKSTLAAGWAIPIDVGLNLNLPFGFRVSAVARNLNGTYTMQNYSELGLWVNEMAESSGGDPVYTDADTGDNEVTDFTYTIPWTLDMGLGWTPDLGDFGKTLRPSIAVDVVDVLGAIETSDDIWNNLIVGAEVRLLSFLDIRAGLNKGYMSVGAGLDLLVIHLDASYYWREFGELIGDKPIDALTVRVNLGVDG